MASAWAQSAKAVIRVGYDAAAAGFAAAADRQIYRHLARPLADALAGIDSPLLDVAAGAGALGRWFGDVVAVDIAAGQLTYNPARRRVLADAERLPFRDDSFHATGCAFGINHFPDPGRAVREMARVASVVGVLTWMRPEPGYAPKDIVNRVLTRHVGRSRSVLGEATDTLGDAVGSAPAVDELLATACRHRRVREVTVTVPWPGHDAYLDYRLGMPSTIVAGDERAIREEATAAFAGLAAEDLDWHAVLVLGVGQR